MERIHLPGGDHFFHQQAISLHHDLRIGGLHGHHNVVVAVVLANPNKFHRRLHHSERGVAIATHDAIGEGAMVGADAHGRAFGLADFYQGRKSIVDAL